VFLFCEKDPSRAHALFANECPKFSHIVDPSVVSQEAMDKSGHISGFKLW
jgi:hypothetical protein